MNKTIKTSPLIGLAVFAVVIAVMLLVAAPIQGKLGMVGLAITEVLLLLCGLIPALIFKWPMKEIFALKRPKIKQIFGTIVIWFGTYLLVMVVTLVIMLFFPDEMTATGTAIGNLFSSIPFILSFLIVAVMPAICEEVLHRGFILYTFKNVKNKWITIVSMGVIFGIFHLDPVRGLPTAILGGALTYVMLETKNLLYPMIFHFINNALSVSVSSLFTNSSEVTEGITGTVTTDVVTQSMPAVVGLYIIFCAGAPLILFVGGLLLHTKEENADDGKIKRNLMGAIIFTVILAVVGTIIVAMNFSSLAELATL